MIALLSVIGTVAVAICLRAQWIIALMETWSESTVFTFFAAAFAALGWDFDGVRGMTAALAGAACAIAAIRLISVGFCLPPYTIPALAMGTSEVVWLIAEDVPNGANTADGSGSAFLCLIAVSVVAIFALKFANLRRARKAERAKQDLMVIPNRPYKALQGRTD